MASFYKHEATKINMECFAVDHQPIKEFLVVFQKKALELDIQACKPAFNTFEVDEWIPFKTDWNQDKHLDHGSPISTK